MNIPTDSPVGYLMVHTEGIWVVSRILLLRTFATVNIQRKKKKGLMASLEKDVQHLSEQVYGFGR